MKIMATFKCESCKAEYEKRIDNTVKVIDCECGKLAVKQLSMPKFTNNSCGKNAAWS